MRITSFVDSCLRENGLRIVAFHVLEMTAVSLKIDDCHGRKFRDAGKLEELE